MSDMIGTETDEFVQAFTDALESRFASVEPSPETDPAAPGGDQPVEGPEPSSPETPDETPEPAPEPATPDEGGAPEEGHGQPSPAFTFSGVDYSPEQLTQAVQVHDWFSRLDPAQVQAIDALMSGQYTLAPRAPAVPQPQTPGTAPASAPSSPAASEDEGDWLDPRAHQEIGQLRQQIDDLQQSVRQSLTPVVQSQQQADYNQRLATINRAHSSFQTKYQLPDDAMETLEGSIAQAQILPALEHRHGGLEQGMNAALEMMFWTTPTYRDPYVAQQTASLQAEQAQESAASLRKQHLTALSGSGGSAPRREPVPSSQEDRHAAMTAEIAAAMNGNGQV